MITHNVVRSLVLVLGGLLAGVPAVHTSQVGTGAFDGGGSGGVNPSPPNSILPVAPTLLKPGGYSRLLLTVVAPVRRVVVLRTRDGELLDVAVALGLPTEAPRVHPARGPPELFDAGF